LEVIARKLIALFMVCPVGGATHAEGVMRRRSAVYSDPAPGIRRGGFTLIELLVVMGLIGLLTGIGLGVIRGAKQQASVNQARAELGLIGGMLESYRRAYGDYPQTVDSPRGLHQALLGRLGPEGAAIAGPSLLGPGEIPLRDPAHPDDPTNSWVDPWGREYEYVFYTRSLGDAPQSRGYVLYSHGSREASEVLARRTDVVPQVTGEAGGVVSLSPPNMQVIHRRR
jgi:prepilin-type N-terminal cleavage/methylation domain-containing protein